MKKTLIIWLILIIFIILIIFAFFAIFYINNNIKDKGGMENENIKQHALQKISYTISGDSIGSYSSKEIEHFDNYDLLTVISKPSLNDETLTKEFKLPSDTLLLFTYVINNYNYKNWNNLLQSDIYALDAGTHNITIQFSNNESYSVSKRTILPKDEEQLFSDVIEFLDKNMSNM